MRRRGWSFTTKAVPSTHNRCRFSGSHTATLRRALSDWRLIHLVGTFNTFFSTTRILCILARNMLWSLLALKWSTTEKSLECSMHQLKQSIWFILLAFGSIQNHLRPTVFRNQVLGTDSLFVSSIDAILSPLLLRSPILPYLLMYLSSSFPQVCQ